MSFQSAMVWKTSTRKLEKQLHEEWKQEIREVIRPATAKNPMDCSENIQSGKYWSNTKWNAPRSRNLYRAISLNETIKLIHKNLFRIHILQCFLGIPSIPILQHPNPHTPTYQDLLESVTHSYALQLCSFLWPTAARHIGEAKNIWTKKITE